MEKIWKSLINLYFLMEGMKLQIYIIQSYFAFIQVSSLICLMIFNETTNKLVEYRLFGWYYFH